MKKNPSPVFVDKNSTVKTRPIVYRIVEASNEEMRLSIKRACDEFEIIKKQNKTLAGCSHSFFVTIKNK